MKQAEPLHRDYKTRNILTLEERVQVIRDFERNPVYQRLAEKYSCSSKQIKNIVASKETVLHHYANRHTDAANTDERRRRQQKIAFLGQVIYEYVQRAVYHGAQLSEASVRQKALEVKESIAIMNFYPNSAWMQNFKAQYGLPALDLMALRQALFLDEAKEESFKAVDIIQFVSRREKLEQRRRGEPGPDDGDDDDDETNSADDGPPAKQPKLEPGADRESPSPPPPPPPPLPDIGSYREALRHLQVLEDFAMLGENFRAIGLITQLQQVLRDPPRSDDFEA